MYDQKKQWEKCSKENTVKLLCWFLEGMDDTNVKERIEIVKNMAVNFPECKPAFMRLLQVKARDFFIQDDKGFGVGNIKYFVDFVEVFGADHAESFADVFQTCYRQLIQVSAINSPAHAIKQIVKALPGQKGKIFNTVLSNLRATFNKMYHVDTIHFVD